MTLLKRSPDESVTVASATDSSITGTPGSATYSWLGRASVALTLSWVAVIALLVLPQFPPHAIQLPAQETLNRVARIVTPEGWAFFTRSPRESKLAAWRLNESHEWVDALKAPYSEPRNAFGFDRAPRAQATEMGILSGQVPESEWQPCPLGPLAGCATAPLTTVAVSNPSPEPTLCGKVMLTTREPVPWAWSESTDPDDMRASAVYLEATCAED